MQMLANLLLFICIHVYGGNFTNFALMKVASQSGPQIWGPENAVNGINNTNIDSSNNILCSYVETFSVFGWWQIDLGISVVVNLIRITPTQYNSGLPRNFKIEVLPSPECGAKANFCFHYAGQLQKAQAESIYCRKPTRGQIVRLSSQHAFYLCEVEVYGVSHDTPVAFRDEMFQRHEDNRQFFTSSTTRITKSVVGCSILCLMRNGCNSFNTKSHQGAYICETSHSQGHSSQTNISHSPAWSFWQLDVCFL